MVKAGDRVRIPSIEGTGSGLTRYGTVMFVEGPFVRVLVKYGNRVRRENTYTQQQLEDVAQAFREERRRKAWLAATRRSNRKADRRKDLEAL